MALSSGVRMSFGIVMNPLSQEFGWTRTSLSTIVFMTSIVTGLMQMVAGVLVDRLGPRRVMGIGVALLGLGVWLLTVSTRLWQFGLAYGLFVGLGLVGTQQVVTATLVANWFTRHRGFAQSMIGSAAAVGWMIVVPVNMFLAHTYDWMTMYRTLGTVLLVGMLPLVWVFIRNRPEDMRLRAYGEEASGAAATAPSSGATTGVSLRLALRDVGTWKLVYLGFA
ncbi:MAG: MFS transporter [Candidatus Tectomicrobia bacterium]